MSRGPPGIRSVPNLLTFRSRASRRTGSKQERAISVGFGLRDERGSLLPQQGASPPPWPGGPRLALIAVATITASHPSSIASAASEAVPTPASKIDGNAHRLCQKSDVVRVADAEA